jgi:hypothetical protein
MGYKAPPKGNMRTFMGSYSTGRRPFALAVSRAALVSLGLAAALALSACTTTEGTNALTDFGTFEREVMTSTLQGFGVVPKGEKEETNQRRAPLVLPKDGGPLPAPQEAVEVASLPVDSDNVQIDTTGLTEDDLKRLRNARVVDLRTLDGRPLTDAEAKQLTARMTAARLKTGHRPLYMPPEEYFVSVGEEAYVCMSKKGQLVPVTHKDCPYEIKEAIGRKQVQSGGRLGNGPNSNLSEDLGLDD